jgi:hypothetical protein
MKVMKNIILSIVLGVMCMSCCSNKYAAANISGDWKIDNVLGAEVNATEETPFIITDQGELELVTDFPDCHFRLANDIELDGTWVPLCKQTSSEYFYGVFDGAGYTISNLFNDSSKYILTPLLTANGQTPPTACPINGSTSSNVNIFAFNPNIDLYFELSTLTSPAVTIKIGPSLVINDMVLAILQGSQFKAKAANSTVALDTSNS